MKARSNKTNSVAPEGVHFARVVVLSDIGHQPGFKWSGGEVDSSYKLELVYELVNTQMSEKDDRPFWVAEEVTNTDNERGKLKSRVLATGASFSKIEEMVGKPVMLTIEHNDKGYPKVTNVAGVPAGTQIPELRNEPVVFDIYADPAHVDAYLGFPEFKQNKIKDALDFAETPLYKALVEQGHMDESGETEY